jgi:hypothetical protein
MKKWTILLAALIFAFGVTSAQAVVIGDAATGELNLYEIVNTLAGTSFTANSELEAFLDADGVLPGGDFYLRGKANYAVEYQLVGWRPPAEGLFFYAGGAANDETVVIDPPIPFSPPSFFRFFDISGGDFFQTQAPEDGFAGIQTGIFLALPGGKFFAAFEDGFGGDYDYNDAVAYFTPIPIPGAVWLLGSGLIGLLGFRRRRN